MQRSPLMVPGGRSFWQLSQLHSSSGLNQRAISLLADSTESEPWQMLRPTWMQMKAILRVVNGGIGPVLCNLVRFLLNQFDISLICLTKPCCRDCCVHCITKTENTSK